MEETRKPLQIGQRETDPGKNEQASDGETPQQRRLSVFWPELYTASKMGPAVDLPLLRAAPDMLSVQDVLLR